MSGQPRLHGETDLQDAFRAGDLKTLARRTLARYGDEVRGFLVAKLRNDQDAQEVYAMFSEDFWRSLADFGFRCSMRSWVYTLARNASIRFAAAPERKRAQQLPTCEDAFALSFADTVRLATKPYLRTDIKQRFRDLREQLSSDDQTLLMLHVDRQLGFRDLAVVMSGTELSEEALARETTRLRKRFERVKAELKRKALDAGLIGE